MLICSALYSGIHVFQLKTLIIHVSNNVFLFPYNWYFLWIWAFFYVLKNKNTYIFFCNFIIFLHKGYFTCVVAFWYTSSGQTQTRDVIGNDVLFYRIGCFSQLLSVLVKIHVSGNIFFFPYRVFAMHFGVFFFLLNNKLRNSQNIYF